ncbi:glycosyltransferase family 2 protein [Ensifer adhaerens]|uniref:glycosyltransferase family 2 protein n=1 Tax=Ensifer adhaerens TaxID=106592 RepID=UPI00137927E5|nr:glycosyltransferase family 2 protein [Ensifer adhaerens]
MSIGVPTYNGVETIAECLRCLQEQSFEDFEVFISDNGSTDGTSDVCAAFAKPDRRFHHFRSAETVPAAVNFTSARDLTNTPYFMWRADDDLTDGEHLERMVNALDRSPAAAVAVSPVLRITEYPTYQRKMYEPPSLSDETEVGRIRSLLLGCHPSWIYGLWRREPLVRSWDMVSAQYPYLWAADHLVLMFADP